MANRGWTGLLAATAIYVTWFTLLWLSLSQGFHTIGASALVGTMLTFINTGLFITAHDAMHGTVCPSFPTLNRIIGRIFVVSYALFSWKKLCTAHSEHHAHPATDHDPDYHRANPAFWSWYLAFLKNYVSVAQIAGMGIVFNLLIHVGGVPETRVWGFWVLPLILSTLQLFYFGTYLPHRLPREGYQEPHRARSLAYPTWLSFITCYHFGYHWEHHEYPHVPWWKLPSTRA